MSLINRRQLLSAGAAGLALSALPRFALAQDLPQAAIAIIGDGRTGPWATAQTNILGTSFSEAVGANIRWQPGFTASLPVMEALRAGDVDFTFATSTAVVNAIDVGIPITPIAAFPLPVDAVDGLTLTGSGIANAADLKGRKVAYQRGTTGHYSLLKYLESAGLTIDDVEGISLAGTDGFTALSQGSVDAWFHWQPAATIGIARLGAERVQRLPDVPTHDYAFYVARDGFYEQHPEIAHNLVAQIRNVQEKINADPAGTVAGWAQAGGFAEGSVEAQAFEQLLTERRTSESTAVNVHPVDDRAAEVTQAIADSFVEMGVLPRHVDVTGFLADSRFDAVRAATAARLEN